MLTKTVVALETQAVLNKDVANLEADDFTENVDTLDHSGGRDKTRTGDALDAREKAKKHASSFRVLVLFGVAAAFRAAFLPHMTEFSVASKLAEANNPVACPPQWLPVLLAANIPTTNGRRLLDNVFTDKEDLRTALLEYDSNLDTAKGKYGPIAEFDVSDITDMSGLFQDDLGNFNEDISSWDTSGVTDMSNMFAGASAFNQPLGFDTSSVTDMSNMFYFASAFNQPLDFDTSSVTDMSDMFGFASAFNQPLDFDTSSVTDMSDMFGGATSLSDQNKLLIRCAWEGSTINNGQYGDSWAPGACPSLRQPVDLRTAKRFALLTKTGITTTGETSVTGDIGCSPITGAAMTGFGITLDHSGEFSTSPRVSGRLYAADYAVPAPAMMGTAIADMGTAYADAAARVTPDTVELGAGDVNGMSLLGGLHKWSSSVSFTDSLTFNAGTNPDTVWILQIAGSLNLGTGARVTLKNGAKASNIFWQIAGAVAIPAGAHAEGVILCKTAIIFGAGSSLNGRALAQTAVTMIATTIVAPLGGVMVGDTPFPSMVRDTPAECFFAFSTDQSMIYLALTQPPHFIYDSSAFESGLIGKIWAGVSLTITPVGVQSLFNLKLETVTSPNLPPAQGGVTAVVSEEFCLEHGTYSVETTAPTGYDYATKKHEVITNPSILEIGVSPDYAPWAPRWGIFPIALRPSAMEAKASEWTSTDRHNPLPGLKWLDDNIDENKYAIQCRAPFRGTVTVPTPQDSRRRLGAGDSTTCN